MAIPRRVLAVALVGCLGYFLGSHRPVAAHRILRQPEEKSFGSVTISPDAVSIEDSFDDDFDDDDDDDDDDATTRNSAGGNARNSAGDNDDHSRAAPSDPSAMATANPSTTATAGLFYVGRGLPQLNMPQRYCSGNMFDSTHMAANCQVAWVQLAL